jgi:hypothetical protein
VDIVAPAEEGKFARGIKKTSKQGTHEETIEPRLHFLGGYGRVSLTLLEEPAIMGLGPMNAEAVPTAAATSTQEVVFISFC